VAVAVAVPFLALNRICTYLLLHVEPSDSSHKFLDALGEARVVSITDDVGHWTG
jgi:hypothetical protein